MHVEGFVRVWNILSTLKTGYLHGGMSSTVFSVITSTCVSSYVIPIYLSLILNFADMSLLDTGRLKTFISGVIVLCPE